MASIISADNDRITNFSNFHCHFRYPLTHDEIVKLRRLNYKRLQHGDSHARSIVDAERPSQSSSDLPKKLSSMEKSKTSKRSVARKKSTSSKQSVDDEKVAATRTDTEMNSANVHPLSAESRPVKGEIMAVGNFELQHLNLSCSSSRTFHFS